LGNYALGVALALLALAFLVVFVVVTFRIFKALITTVWSGREGLNPLNAQGRFRLFGIVCLVAASALLIVGMEQGLDVLVLIVAAGALVFSGIHLFQRAKRFDAPSGIKVLSEHQRSPVLYLRSFDDDPKVARRVGIAGFKLSNEEEDLAEIVSTLGPFVAIGRPGEVLPYSGAARMYVGEGDWHERVRQLLSLARLVILRAGDTPGLWWEVEESAKTVRPERLVFLVPLKQREYDDFRRKAKNYLPCELPQYAGRRIPATTIRSVLLFDSDWTPHLLPVQETYFGYYGRVLLTFPLFTPFLLLNSVFLRKQSHTRRVLDKTFQPILQRGVETSDLDSAGVPQK
jgi:ABC-type multidrug transport system fused ATPase/permease subunit